jgi:hypothetical protein
MKIRIAMLVIFVCAALFSVASACDDTKVPVEKEWTKIIDEKEVHFMTIDGVLVHEKNAPLPLVVRPGTHPRGNTPGTPPSDAVVLFDGTEKTFNHNWTDTKGKGGKTKWILKDGAMQPTKHSGMIQSKQVFGSCQLHIEFRTPANIRGNGQGRGNSGVFLMGTYEVQILDSYQKSAEVDKDGTAIYDNATYADGQAGALYGRQTPKKNACRKPGEWQSYDILFNRPIFDKAGKLVKKATFIVMHNGVFIQNTILHGGTGWRGRHCATHYRAHADKLPIKFQDHGNPVCFRNVWIREIAD